MTNTMPLPSNTNLLSLVGLLVLATFEAPALKTALTGSPSFLDSLILSPGLHQQHKAARLSGGEFPACAAMTSGYVFRVENPATVLYLQRIGETGKLTTLSVSKEKEAGRASAHELGLVHVCAALSMLAMAFLARTRDWAALAFLLALVSVRSVNSLVIRRQAQHVKWHGQSEPGQKGDLLVLLSYDRWVRLRGEVDDLKAVTSGRWQREADLGEQALTGLATCLAYLSPSLVVGATAVGQIVVVAVLLANGGLLGVGNYFTATLRMKGRVLRVEGERKAYARRSVLASELVAESGRDDWALAMGLVPWSNNGSGSGGSQQRGSVTM